MKTILAILAFTLTLAIAGTAYADGGPPTIPAQASVPNAPEAPGQPIQPATPATPVRRLAATGDNSGQLALYGAIALGGGAVLLVVSKSGRRA